MKIHHVVDSLGLGGAETLVAALSRVQRDSGNDVVVHTLLGSGPVAEILNRTNIPIVYHMSGSTVRVIASLYNALRRDRPDILHCHNITATVFGAPAARLAHVPAVVTTRHGPATSNDKRERRFWLAARLCKRVVAVSDGAMQSLASVRWALPAMLTTIRNGAAYPCMDPGEPVDGGKRGFVIVSVGRLTPEKDFATLIRAVGMARAVRPDLELWILGEGAERRKLEALIEELRLGQVVKLLGAHPNVGFWLKQGDLFVLASVCEGLPMSLLEAMAVGVPPLVTSVGGMPEVVRACGGTVVPPSNVDALAAAILKLADPQYNLVDVRRAVQQYYNEHFTAESMAKRYLTLYAECLGKSN